MPTYAFTARDMQGKALRGRRAAADEAHLRRELRDEGVLLVRSRPDRGVRSGRRLRRVKPRELILFTFNLQNVVDSGVPLLSGLDDMKAETRSSGFREIIGDIVDGVTGGETLFQAMRRHPAAFDSLYVNMIDAGEQSGRLPHVLERLVQLLEWQEEFRRRIRDLVTYPIVVLVAMIGLIGLVVGFVFPRFAEIFRRVSFELPLPTRILIGASEFVTQWWPVLLGSGVVLWAGAVVLGRIPRVRLGIDGAWLKVPVIGELVEMLNFGQIARSLSSFLDSGIAIPQALDMISRMVPNRRVGVSVQNAREAILGGETLGGALTATRIFPPLLIRMVKLGEQSGRLVEALEKAATIYDREIPVRTKRVLEMMNPILTVIIGGLLMFVILSVMMPLYGMYQQIGTSY